MGGALFFGTTAPAHEFLLGRRRRCVSVFESGKDHGTTGELEGRSEDR